MEGYSNFLFLAVMASAVRMGLDIDTLAQLLSFAAAGVTLALVHRRLAPGPSGTLALLALAVWAPLGHWAGIGLETTLYAALLAGGWSLVLGAGGGWGTGVVLLALASLTRPEGLLHLAIGLLTAARARPGRPGRLAAVGAVVALAVYHGARIAWFGHLLPTPLLVKVLPVGPTRFGALQVAGDLATATGVLGATVLAGRAARRDVAWAVAPMAVQGLTLWCASGDWMAWGRLTLPGVIGTVAAYTSVARPREAVSRTAFAGMVIAATVCGLLEPRGYGVIDLRARSIGALARSVSHLSHGLDTPLAEDVAWAVDHVPTGAEVLAVDVGILGDIPGVRVVDMRGLTHRSAAEAISRGEGEAWLRTALGDSTGRPAFLRLANWEGTEHPDYPDWMLRGYRLRADLLYGGGSVRWYAADEAAPSIQQREERWDEMLRRHPAHPFLRWHAALSAAADGRTARAELLLAEGSERWPGMDEFTDGPRSLAIVAGTRALSWSSAEGLSVRCSDRVVTRMIEAKERLSFRVAEPSTEDLRLLVEDPCGATAAGPNVQLSACDRPRQVSMTVDCGSATSESDVHLSPA